MDSAPASKLSSSDVSFPRGGGSVLSSVELKTIANKANEDVLFEHKVATVSKKRAAPNDRSSKKKLKKKLSSGESAETEKLITITHFTFKNMLPGAEVLGQIKTITKGGLLLVLGDNLVGFVRITAISGELSEQLERYANAQESEDEDMDDEENTVSATSSFKPEMPELSNLFKVGQWLRAVVVEGEENKKSINLTTVPERVNASITSEDLTPGNVLQGSVKSIEDHGIVFSLGLNQLTGFMSKKELKKADANVLDYTPGQVHLLSVVSANERAVSLRPATNENVSKKTVVSTISSIDAVHPGAIVNAVVAEVTDYGVVARVFGMADASIALAHAHEFSIEGLKNLYAIGSTVRTRVLGIVQEDGAKKFILSRAARVTDLIPELNAEPLQAFPMGFVFHEMVEVIGADSLFIYVSTGSGEIRGQVHKSNADPEKVVNIEYPVGSRHRARVIGFNEIDNLLRLTLNPVTIDSKFASADDITIGEYIPLAEVTQILPDDKGILVKIFGQFEAMVPTKHLSDIKLVYPERKFKVGSKFKGRVYGRKGRKIFVTLRKTLVNMEDEAVISKMGDLSLGLKSIAIVEKFAKGGAVVTFFNNMRAFLPNTEISEAFVTDALQYLKENQAVSVRILAFSEEDGKVSVTLRQAAELSDKQAEHLEEIKVGRSIIKASVVEKSKEAIIVELEGSNLKGVISTCHLSDGNYEENRILFKSIAVGSSLDIVVLEKDFRNRNVTASAKKSLINAAKLETLPIHYEDLHVGQVVPGYLKSVTNMGLFVRFCGKLTGLVLPRDASVDPSEDLLKRFYKDQSISCEVIKLDHENKRFLLSLGDAAESSRTVRLKNPVDKSKRFASDYLVNEKTSGVIETIEGDHLLVRLADGFYGRVHASQCLTSWKAIRDTRTPLDTFKPGQPITCKIIGFYNQKSHKFTTRGTPNPSNLMELSNLAGEIDRDKPYMPAPLEHFEIGSEHVAYIERFNHGIAIVNIAPGVRGHVALYNLSDNLSLYQNFDENFPVGAALKVKVVTQDFKFKILVLSARDTEITSVSQVSIGDKLPARIFKVTESFLLLELGNGVNALSDIHEALNDYDQVLQDVYKVDQAVLATVSSVDTANQKITVSLRDDKNAKDRFIRAADELKRGDLVKGFVKSIADIGLHVALGRNVSALVRVSDISDAFLVDWKKFFRPNQCIMGKVSQNKDGRILLTLKESEVNGDLTSFKTFDELEVGQNYDGSVKQAMEFGVFVKLDGTANISGLCHRSEISDNKVENASALFGVGDRVKVKILKIDQEKKQLSLGMKASYFTDIQEDSGVEIEGDDEEENVGMVDFDEDVENEDVDEDEEDNLDKDGELSSGGISGLSTNGFDWTASILDQVEDAESSEDDTENFMNADRKKRKNKKQVEDKTGEINARAPQSVGDFERLLVGNPNSSILWMNYMSFQLQLGEIDKSREIAERALKTINYRDEQEKLNIWIAILNLENSFGSEESLAEAFKRAVQYMDALTMYQKLIGIYQLSEKFDKAEELFKAMTKKFSQNVTMWVQNGSFYFKREMPDEAHLVLARALQALPKRDHIEIVRKFGQLEFSEGDPEQGRSLFEGLITDAPKRIDLWNVYLDQEIKQGDKSRVESLFERVFTKKLSKKQAKFFFSKWLSYEEDNGDEQAAARVKALAIEFVQKQSSNDEE